MARHVHVYWVLLCAVILTQAYARPQILPRSQTSSRTTHGRHGNHPSIPSSYLTTTSSTDTSSSVGLATMSNSFVAMEVTEKGKHLSRDVQSGGGIAFEEEALAQSLRRKHRQMHRARIHAGPILPEVIIPIPSRPPPGPPPEEEGDVMTLLLRDLDLSDLPRRPFNNPSGDIRMITVAFCNEKYIRILANHIVAHRAILEAAGAANISDAAWIQAKHHLRQQKHGHRHEKPKDPSTLPVLRTPFVIVAFDEVTQTTFRRLGVPTILSSSVVNASPRNKLFWHRAVADPLHKIWLERYIVIEQLLEANLDVFLADADAIPCSDPWSYVMHHFPDDDIVGGAGMWPNTVRYNGNEEMGTINAGYTFLRVSAFSKLVVGKMVEQMAPERLPDDQETLNQVLYSMYSDVIDHHDGSYSILFPPEMHARVSLLPRFLFPSGGCDTWNDLVITTFCHGDGRFHGGGGGKPSNQFYTTPMIVHPTCQPKTMIPKMDWLKAKGRWFLLDGDNEIDDKVTSLESISRYTPCSQDRLCALN
eukprot:TRINITY_DN172_c0_g2_i1.p1 TRINITY_DN172_c0_g2~~TRINITY_DN172_c0_g2_i1.p1  ORF type:complete len:532 (-),score=49.94 TRINITY_DN172_c0_g2_i1:38-1633(-)